MGIELAGNLLRMITLPLSIYLLAGAFLNHRTGKPRRLDLLFLLLVSILTDVVSYFVQLSLHDYFSLQIAVNLAIVILASWMVLRLFAGRFTSKLFVGGLGILLLTISDGAAVILYGVFVGQPSYASPWGMQIISSAVKILVCLCIWLLRSKIVFTRKNARLYVLQTVAFGLNFILMSAVMISVLRSGGFTALDLLLELGLLAASLLMFLCFEAMETVYRRNQEYALQEQQHTMREEYYTEVEAHQKEVRTLKHDMKNMLLSLGAYIREDKSDVVGKEIEKLIGTLAESDQAHFTAHAGLNALLGAKYRLAQAGGILCDFDVKVPSDMAIGENDLASVVGNVLDNAIEACRYCSGRKYIRLIIAYYANTLALSCENSTDDTMRTLETRKQDKKSHGIGMGSIRETVAKYKGLVQHRFDDYSFQIELTMYTT